MTNPLFREVLLDADDNNYAVVTRNVNPAESLDYVAIKHHDDLINDRHRRGARVPSRRDARRRGAPVYEHVWGGRTRRDPLGRWPG